MRMRLLLSLIVIAWIPAAVSAQISNPVHRDWEFGFFGAFSSMGERTCTTPVAGVSGQTSREVGLKYSSALEMGVGFTQNFGKHWAINLEYSFSNQPLTFTNLADTVPVFSAGQAIHRMAYQFLYHVKPRDERLRPYVFIGPGVSLFHIHGDAKTAAVPLGMSLTDSWKPTINWGGGAKFLFQDHLAAHVQLSDAISGVPTYGLPQTAAFWSNKFHPGFAASGLVHNWRIGVGLIYQWD